MYTYKDGAKKKRKQQQKRQNNLELLTDFKMKLGVRITLKRGTASVTTESVKSACHFSHAIQKLSAGHGRQLDLGGPRQWWVFCCGGVRLCISSCKLFEAR